MQHKSLIFISHAVLGILAMLALSGQAMATTTVWGAQPVPSSINYGDTFAAPQSQFYDDYLFSIPTTSVNSITSTISLGNLLGINNLQSRLYSGTLTTTGVPSGLLVAWSAPILFGGTGTVAVIDPVTLGAGDYILEIRGDVIGTSGGSYAGVLNISPVPEAGEWVMLFFGLGLIGFIAARRSYHSGFTERHAF